MNVEVIDPFLKSAQNVLEQLIQVSASKGTLAVKNVELIADHVWIMIGMTGQMSGNVMFGLHEQVALRIVSLMMGGFILTELDEMGHSAISELGNMISGNASTLLSNQGIAVDITPPQVLKSVHMTTLNSTKALSIPLMIDGVGELDIQVMIS